MSLPEVTAAPQRYFTKKVLQDIVLPATAAAEYHEKEREEPQATTLEQLQVETEVDKNEPTLPDEPTQPVVELRPSLIPTSLEPWNDDDELLLSAPSLAHGKSGDTFSNSIADPVPADPEPQQGEVEAEQPEAEPEEANDDEVYSEDQFEQLFEEALDEMEMLELHDDGAESIDEVTVPAPPGPVLDPFPSLRSGRNWVRQREPDEAALEAPTVAAEPELEEPQEPDAEEPPVVPPVKVECVDAEMETDPIPISPKPVLVDVGTQTNIKPNPRRWINSGTQVKVRTRQCWSQTDASLTKPKGPPVTFSALPLPKNFPAPQTSAADMIYQATMELTSANAAKKKASGQAGSVVVKEPPTLDSEETAVNLLRKLRRIVRDCDARGIMWDVNYRRIEQIFAEMTEITFTPTPKGWRATLNEFEGYGDVKPTTNVSKIPPDTPPPPGGLKAVSEAFTGFTESADDESLSSSSDTGLATPSKMRNRRRSRSVVGIRKAMHRTRRSVTGSVGESDTASSGRQSFSGEPGGNGEVPNRSNPVARFSASPKRCSSPKPPIPLHPKTQVMITPTPATPSSKENKDTLEQSTNLDTSILSTSTYTEALDSTTQQSPPNREGVDKHPPQLSSVDIQEPAPTSAPSSKPNHQQQQYQNITSPCASSTAYAVGKKYEKVRSRVYEGITNAQQFAMFSTADKVIKKIYAEGKESGALRYPLQQARQHCRPKSAPPTPAMPPPVTEEDRSPWIPACGTNILAPKHKLTTSCWKEQHETINKITKAHGPQSDEEDDSDYNRENSIKLKHAKRVLAQNSQLRFLVATLQAEVRVLHANVLQLKHHSKNGMAFKTDFLEGLNAILDMDDPPEIEDHLLTAKQEKAQPLDLQLKFDKAPALQEDATLTKSQIESNPEPSTKETPKKKAEVKVVTPPSNKKEQKKPGSASKKGKKGKPKSSGRDKITTHNMRKFYSELLSGDTVKSGVFV